MNFFTLVVTALLLRDKLKKKVMICQAFVDVVFHKP